jgi:hypothetical protein
MKDDFYILKAIQDRKNSKKAKVIARHK